MAKSDEIVIIRGMRFVVTDCGRCGAIYTVPETMFDAMRAEGGFAHCQNGHGWGWKEGSRQRDELRAERDRLKQSAAQKDDEIAALHRDVEALKKSRAAVRGEYTKVKKRIHSGVCPCCNRTFQNLAAHMKTMHKDYDKDNVIPLKTA